MKRFISLSVFLLANAISAHSQTGIKPSNFGPDFFISAAKFYKPEGSDKYQGDAMKDVALGAIYKFQRFDPVEAEWTYDIAIGAHVIFGYLETTQLAFTIGPSLFNGWLHIEGGPDVINGGAVFLIGTDPSKVFE